MAARTDTLPIPDYFSFEWDSPEEAAEFWTVDQMHWPHGVSPMSQTFDLPPFNSHRPRWSTFRHCNPGKGVSLTGCGGTKVGTSLIRDGQKVTVDGDAGTVKLED